jgi:hypothetical protein
MRDLSHERVWRIGNQKIDQGDPDDIKAHGYSRCDSRMRRQDSLSIKSAFRKIGRGRNVTPVPDQVASFLERAGNPAWTIGIQVRAGP